MELRSSRSRSKTPFLVQNVDTFDKEIIEKGNHVEKTVIKTTTIKTSESSHTISSKDEFESYSLKPEKKTRRSLRSKLVKTSDYSSEDGESELSSLKTINQNEKNQLIEDARAAANGSSEISALDLYRKSGRYWDVYPKTDWTYSYHSKDRVEIAPGVVAMPNMSRRTIHSINDSSVVYSDNVSHKNVNTDGLSLDSCVTAFDSDAHVRRRLFNNNRDDAYFKSEYKLSFRQRIARVVRSLMTTVATVFYFVFRANVSAFRYLHTLTSYVMLLDTYLLWKTRPVNKKRAILMLCFVPLALIGGWWLMATAGSSIWDTVSTIPSYLTSTSNESTTIPIIADINNNRYDKESLQQSSVSRDYDKPTVQPEIVKIVEKIYVEPPTADEVAAGLSEEQLRKIAQNMKESINLNEELNTDEIVQKIILSPTFQNVINNYNNVNVNRESGSDVNIEISKRQEEIIIGLKEEINKLKEDILQAEKRRREEFHNIILQMKNENNANNAKLTFELNRCCRKPIINIETYVNRILTSLLNNPEFLSNQKGLNDWLHSLFMAKKDLEFHLSNFTTKLNSKFDVLVEDNTKKMMDDVASKLSLEMNKKVFNVEHNVKTVKRDVTDDCLTDDYVKKIVKSTLATYDADKTGLVDYAMETMGGQIITTRCTENYHYGKAVVSVLGIPLWYPVNSPRTVITPSINPGECWAFQNFPGFLVIKLSNKVNIEAFSLEHISRLLVPEGRIDSAPKEFEVYGLMEENDRNPVLLGKYIYDYDGEPLQYFPVENTERVFDMVELRVISNHGNPNYTCLYRFRVHGRIHHENT